MSSKEKVATAFGTNLDHDNFEATKELLTTDCVYDCNGEKIIGNENIINSYETNMKEGRQKFDQLVWGKCFITPLSSDEYEVHFSDFLTHKGITHNYKCKQKLYINDQFLIYKIIHIELRGEKEKLNNFYQKVGLPIK